MKGLLNHPVFKFFSSLKLAVFTILLLAAVLTYGTLAESNYGTRAAHLLVYGTRWFGGVLFLLGLNVFSAALSRWPWKVRHIGFLVTHLGIIVILLGSYVSREFGVDGNLPINEGRSNDEVILQDLELRLFGESQKTPFATPFPEFPTSYQGNILEVKIPGTQPLKIDHFYPRAFVKKIFKESPVPGLGFPALQLELSNSRFRMKEWLIAPGLKTQVTQIGPARFSLKRAWNEKEEKQFFNPRGPIEKKSTRGHLIVQWQTQEWRLNIDDYWQRWAPIPESPLSLRVDRYLPYAIVDKNELVNRSNEMVNPAVQLQLRDQNGSLERHTLFALFPEFATLHKKEASANKEEIGVHLRMIASNQEQQGMASKRGKMDLLQSSRGDKVFYHSTGSDGATRAKGVLFKGEAVPTGWMDLQMKLVQWLPAAIEDWEVKPVDLIAGGDNFVSAIRYQGPESRDPQWIVEGETQDLQIGDQLYFIQLRRTRLTLPFKIHLKKFTVGTDPGTEKAASFQSEVTVNDPESPTPQAALISMNEPLKHGGYTFYQASYQMEPGQPPVSVLAVNFDPGRMIKYLGSLLIVLGICLMFYLNPHYWEILFGQKKPGSKKESR